MKRIPLFETSENKSTDWVLSEALEYVKSEWLPKAKAIEHSNVKLSERLENTNSKKLPYFILSIDLDGGKDWEKHRDAFYKTANSFMFNMSEAVRKKFKGRGLKTSVLGTQMACEANHLEKTEFSKTAQEVVKEYKMKRSEDGTEATCRFGEAEYHLRYDEDGNFIKAVGWSRNVRVAKEKELNAELKAIGHKLSDIPKLTETEMPSEDTEKINKWISKLKQNTGVKRLGVKIKGKQLILTTGGVMGETDGKSKDTDTNLITNYFDKTSTTYTRAYGMLGSATIRLSYAKIIK